MAISPTSFMAVPSGQFGTAVEPVPSMACWPKLAKSLQRHDD
jgi:hypothetical protein